MISQALVTCYAKEKEETKRICHGKVLQKKLLIEGGVEGNSSCNIDQGRRYNLTTTNTTRKARSIITSKDTSKKDKTY